MRPNWYGLALLFHLKNIHHHLQAEALSSLHASGICHRSLRPEHVLIGPDGHIVLTGFSRASVTAFSSPKSEHKAAMAEKEKLLQGANVWAAPEVVLGWAHNFAVDCWGFGMLVYFMLTGRVSSSSVCGHAAMLITFYRSIPSYLSSNCSMALKFIRA